LGLVNIALYMSEIANDIGSQNCSVAAFHSRLLSKRLKHIDQEGKNP
jgi:hypothetical protein